MENQDPNLITADMLPTGNAAFYAPDPRDYNFAEVYSGWAADQLPTSFIVDDKDYQNQWLKDFTKVACWSFALAHGVNANNMMEWSLAGNRKLGEDLWSRQIKPPYRGSLASGSRLDDQLKQGIAEKLISGYVKIANLSQLKTALAINKQCVYTGTNKCNRSLTKSTHVFTPMDNWPGHFFVIIGYDDEKWVAIVKNSYGPYRSKNGQFEIPYSYLFTHLFWLFALVDMADSNLMKAKRDELNLTKATELGIWNWNDPESAISRKHSVMIVMRVRDNILSEVKKMYGGSETTDAEL
jgi:hypothetical protein